MSVPYKTEFPQINLSAKSRPTAEYIISTGLMMFNLSTDRCLLHRPSYFCPRMKINAHIESWQLWLNVLSFKIGESWIFLWLQVEKIPFFSLWWAAKVFEFSKGVRSKLFGRNCYVNAFLRNAVNFAFVFYTRFTLIYFAFRSVRI